MRTVAIFKSRQFNLTQSRPYFLNEESFGDDLGRWLINRFRSLGLKCDEEPSQEDFGWYFAFELDGSAYRAVIGNIAREMWFVSLERVSGIARSIFGRSTVGADAVSLLHRILGTAAEIHDLRWLDWSDFKRGVLEPAWTTPTAQ